MPDPLVYLDPIDRGLGGLRLAGQALSVDVSQAITNATLEHGLDQAATITIDLHDPSRIILRSDLCTYKVTASFEDVWGNPVVYVLVKVSKTGETMTLTFEDQVVNALRQVKGQLKMARSKISRAAFARRLALDPLAARYVVGSQISFWSPEFDDQPLLRQTSRFGKTYIAPGQAAVGANKGTSSKPNSTKDGTTPSAGDWDPAANLTITSDDLKAVRKPDKNQKENAAICMATALAIKGVNHLILVSMIETIIVESQMRNLTGGDADSVGLFQQRPEYWKGLRNRELATKEYITRAIAFVRTHPKVTPGTIAWNVQNPREDLRGRYEQHRDEAETWVKAYRGNVAVPSSSKGTSSKTKSNGYEFSRNAGESSWDAIKRLADELQWRAFVSGTTVIFAPDAALAAEPVLFQVEDESPGVDSIDFDWDTGKNAATATLMLEAYPSPGIEPGRRVFLYDHGPASGDWLISDVRRSFLGAQTELDLIRPQPSLHDPSTGAAPTSKTTTTPASPSTTRPATPRGGNASPPTTTHVPSGSTPSGATSPGAKAVAWAAQFLGKPYHYGGGHAHAGYTVASIVAYGNRMLRAYPPGPGGDSPEGFDCSGLVRAAWAQQGVYVGGATFDMKDLAIKAGVPHGGTYVGGPDTPRGGWQAGDLMEPHATHVVLMTGVGNGTVEAKGTAYGIVRGDRPGAAYFWARWGGAAT